MALSKTGWNTMKKFLFWERPITALVTVRSTRFLTLKLHGPIKNLAHVTVSIRCKRVHALILNRPTSRETCLCHMRTTKAQISSNQRLCYSLSGQYNTSSFYLIYLCFQNFKPLASVCGCAGRLRLPWSKPPKTDLLVTRLIIITHNGIDSSRGDNNGF